jgi:hypothetical protein
MKQLFSTPSSHKSGVPAIKVRVNAWAGPGKYRLRSALSSWQCVESGIETFEVAFMAYVVLPDGRTVAAYVLPALQNNQLLALTFD